MPGSLPELHLRTPRFPTLRSTELSMTLARAPDQPYAAIPYVGNELNEKLASLRVDPQVGVILFQRPYFASRHDSCGPHIGTHENPDAWWLGRTADLAPPAAGSDPAHDPPKTTADATPASGRVGAEGGRPL